MSHPARQSRARWPMEDGYIPKDMDSQSLIRLFTGMCAHREAATGHWRRRATRRALFELGSDSIGREKEERIGRPPKWGAGGNHGTGGPGDRKTSVE